MSTNHTSAFIFQTWIAFAMAFAATGAGILFLPINFWMRAFLAVGFVFTVSSCFTLAKTIRDEHDRRSTPRRAPDDAAYRNA